MDDPAAAGTGSAGPVPGGSPRGRLFVLSGPSGVGKSTVLVRLRQALPDLWYSVSATTRRPRPGERDGVDYFFLTAEEFAAAVSSGDMLEHAHFAGHDYGTPQAAVETMLVAGRDVLLEIDVQGARQVRRRLGTQAILVFLAPPSFAELARRLAGRGTETDADTAVRLTLARQELAAEGEFDHTVVNTDVDAATGGLVALLAGSRLPGRA